MPLTWADPSGIAAALARACPDVDRLSLCDSELRDIILSLPEFSGLSLPPSEKHLKTVLWAWMRLADADEDDSGGQV